MKFFFYLILVLFTFSACKKKEVITGCTDSVAINYHPLAKEDDGSCRFHYYESDSLESALLSPEIINKIYNFAFYKAFIYTKNIYSITSNYGYEGVFSKGSAFAYLGTVDDGSPFNTIYSKDCDSDSNLLTGFSQLSSGGTANSKFGLNFDCYTGLEFVNIGKIESGNVHKSQGYEFIIDGISNLSEQTQDSLVFGFHYPGDPLYVKKAITLNNIYSFTPEELSQIDQGKGFIEVIGMNNFVYFVGTTPHIICNQTIRTKKVNFYL